MDTALLRATPASTPGYVPVITGRRIAVMLSNGDWMVWGLQDTDGAAILGGDEAMIIANNRASQRGRRLPHVGAPRPPTAGPLACIIGLRYARRALNRGMLPPTATNPQ